MKSVVFALLISCASAFTMAPMAKPTTSLTAELQSMAGATAPLKGFDPLNLATLGSEETLLWFRAAELKHGRVAMLATTGYLVQGAGFHFPGNLATGTTFESLSSMKPFDAWDAVPDSGKAQILFTIFLAEVISESKGVHYTKGGDLPTIVFPPIDFSGVDAATVATKRNRELNNGRLAMIAIMSFIAATNIPGSVPALAGNAAF
eukprot:CAMPEP_0182501738 /NCGR_PEP_ID=MMETSP1321-20130603/12035_1 /TAXON_ID=91990 /ORGANISM="Bolidomonas sp., Strain RCC1657" /LENGTH=204 /DNA_ID=CAMNT_0024706475 /DNA_START=8 /DNA_END=622 /DNA_ORIENTATION=+